MAPGNEQPGAIVGLVRAVAVGFEPTEGVNPHALSRRAPSAARTRYRRERYPTAFAGRQGGGGARRARPARRRVRRRRVRERVGDTTSRSFGRGGRDAE